MKIRKYSYENFVLFHICDSLSTEAVSKLASEIKAKDGNQELLADEEPLCIWTQLQAINFISK